MHQKIYVWECEDCQEESAEYVKYIDNKPEEVEGRNLVIGLGHPPAIIDQRGYDDSLAVDYGQKETFSVVKSDTSS